MQFNKIYSPEYIDKLAIELHYNFEKFALKDIITIIYISTKNHKC
jgi:hypothetical protein